MRIALIEPFYTGSHQLWADGFERYSSHGVTKFTLPGRHWKWRMAAGALQLAKMFENAPESFDLILATDMLDLPTFKAFAGKKAWGIPLALYFHENQITYPWSATDQDPHLRRDHHYGFINFKSACLADGLFFNSNFHRKDFFEGLPGFLNQFPEPPLHGAIEELQEKSAILPIGLELQQLGTLANGEKSAKRNGTPVILWNHRWEYDKDPDTFFEVLHDLKKEGLSFGLIVLGEAYRKSPEIFQKVPEIFRQELLHFGFVPDRATYAKWLWRADILPVTSRQDFFGISVVEAMYCGCLPLLPDRLAFPEHLPEACQRQLLYQSKEELAGKLRKLLTKADFPLIEPKIQNFVSRYDWTKLAPQYDQVLAEMVRF